MAIQTLKAPGFVEQIRRGVRRYGLSGAFLHAASVARRWIGKSIYLHECHVWHRLDLSATRSRIELRSGFDLLRAGTKELPLVEQLPTIGLFEAQRRLEQGAELWLVRQGAQPVFCCWVFRDRTPVLAAKGGWLDLPENTACLEDSVASRGYRGRGIVPAALMEVIEMLGKSGTATVITKVEEHNVAFRRALEKMGFRPVASTKFVRFGWKWRVQVEPHGEDAISAYLTERLSR